MLVQNFIRAKHFWARPANGGPKPGLKRPEQATKCAPKCEGTTEGGSTVAIAGDGLATRWPLLGMSVTGMDHVTYHVTPVVSEACSENWWCSNCLQNLAVYLVRKVLPNGLSCSQGITLMLWILNINYRVYKNLPPANTLSQAKQIHTLFKTKFNIILPVAPTYSQRSSPLRLGN